MMNSPSALIDEYLNLVQGRIQKNIADDDHMAKNSIDGYFSVGRSALRNIATSLAIGNAGDPTSILDFACGAGRVARWLRAAFPEASLSVADINPSWVQFCADTFHANPILSNSDVSKIDLPDNYDLIWVGSLITHLPEQDAESVLSLLHSHLRPGGILVFTVHGRRMVRNQMEGRYRYIDPALFTRIVVAALSAGYGFSPHVPGRATGISLTSVAWIYSWCGQQSDRKLIALTEAGWEDHQDVVAIRRQNF